MSDRALRDELERVQVRLATLRAQLGDGVDALAVQAEYEAQLRELGTKKESLNVGLTLARADLERARRDLVSALEESGAGRRESSLRLKAFERWLLLNLDGGRALGTVVGVLGGAFAAVALLEAGYGVAATFAGVGVLAARGVIRGLRARAARLERR